MIHGLMPALTSITSTVKLFISYNHQNARKYILSSILILLK